MRLKEEFAHLHAFAPAVDEFKPSTGWQGPRAGFVFTTGTHGTGYYKDKAPQSVTAAAPPPAVVSREPSSKATTSSAAASQARPVAAGRAAATLRKVAAHHQQQPGVSKAQLKVPSVTVAAPMRQLVDQGQQVGGLLLTQLADSMRVVS